MSGNLRSGVGAVTRREALGGLAAAAVAAALPGRSWALALEGMDTQPEYLWFPDESAGDVFHAYTVEQGRDGTLWIEYDDGNAYAFEPGEWSLESLVDGHRLWLWETEETWYGYDCLTESEAAVVLV